MNNQAFELLLENLASIKSDISDLKQEINRQNTIVQKIRNKVIATSVIIPFLVSATYKKVDTPPKAIQEAAEKVLKETVE